MQASREHVADCLNQLSQAVAELGRALAQDADKYPRVYMVGLENAKRRITDAHEAIMHANLAANEALAEKCK